MQPTQQSTQEQPLSVPRRTLDVEDYIDVVRRHRSWILAPTFIGLVLGVVVAYLWPDSYLANGTIRVSPPKVPSQLVPTNFTEALTQRIAAIHQNIISRSVLQNIIQTYNLYPDERKRLPMEDVIEQMRKDIQVTPPRGMPGSSAGSVFQVAFSYSDKRLATQVCSDIISRFVYESTQSRSMQTQITTQFLQEQMQSARNQLEAIDSKMAAFRTRNMGHLPDQEQLLLGRLAGLENTIQTLNSSMSRVNQDKLQLETNLRMLRDQAAARALQAQSDRASGSGPGAPASSQRVAEIDREIARLENSISVMRESYTDSHPDVRKMKSYLDAKRKERSEAQAEFEAEQLETRAATKSPASGPVTVRVDPETAAAMGRIQAALQAKDMEFDDLTRRLRDSQARLREAGANLQSSPVAQQEYLQLLREREIAQERFEGLSSKSQMSAMATEVESRQQGEQLEVLEQPVMPSTPYSPKRELIILGGLLLGIGVGVGVASAREIKDTSLKNLKDVRAYTKLTILGSIPLLENDFVVRRRRRLGWLAWAAGLLVGILLMTGSVIYYYTSRA